MEQILNFLKVDTKSFDSNKSAKQVLDRIISEYLPELIKSTIRIEGESSINM